MRSVEYHQGYDVTFTIVNSEPDKQTVSWDIATAADSKHAHSLLFILIVTDNVQIVFITFMN